ncbi:SGNH/GDSL hydrolase family protein [Microbulbifer variabilis]|uniref:SGNH/GDSL hydrolase family protein n=1 Tax=Microbulbifer variabilis TaxID=266805 RepID=UPI00037CDB7C|nr:SGNH/GDSL hydrolase family protein [Microbulbifer variabilis]
MENVLVYSDSVSWGVIPDTRKRMAFHLRWPGVLERNLNEKGCDVRVIENCLNGRKTVWDDPFREGRKGVDGLAQVIEMHSPLKCVLLMLGTNDFQDTHDNKAWMAAQGVAKLVSVIRQAPIEPGMSIPKILIIAPLAINNPKGIIGHKFAGAEQRCKDFPAELEKVSRELGTHYLDANTLVKVSDIDGIHLDEDQHSILGQEVADYLRKIKVLSWP